MLNCLLNQIMHQTKALSNSFHSFTRDEFVVVSWANQDSRSMRSFSIQGLSEKFSSFVFIAWTSECDGKFVFEDHSSSPECHIVANFSLTRIFRWSGHFRLTRSQQNWSQIFHIPIVLSFHPSTELGAFDGFSYRKLKRFDNERLRRQQVAAKVEVEDENFN